MIDDQTRELLRNYAAHYETADFINGDPSWFMHQVDGDLNREAMAFVAANLSYGSRKQFMPKVEWLRQQAGGDMHSWILRGQFCDALPANDCGCFYRLNTVGQMHSFLKAYHQLLAEHGSMGDWLRKDIRITDPEGGLHAIEHITEWFASHGSTGVVPKDARSACKRICMFLRWMVRKDSPVDLGLWSDFIDCRSLIMPLDTHVMQQSLRLGLLQSSSTSMSAAQRLSAALAQIFPSDPLKGDFALFGYGVNTAHS